MYEKLLNYLSTRVPNLQLDHIAGQTESLAGKVDPNGALVLSAKMIIGKSSQKRGFASTYENCK